VLFADIRGSLELIASSDPEEARKLLNEPIGIMMDAVHRFEGTVNRVLGDGIMALFGAPLAHEDHAVRACYAALAMQDVVRAFAEKARRQQGVEIQVRIGLNSGEVVVGSIGNDLSMDYDVVGVTAHLASRMEQLAPPGAIRLTPDTLRLAEGFVDVSSLGPVPVKGLSEPIEVFDLVRASGARTRLQAAVARGLTRFVGRQNELQTLGKALNQTDGGRGQVVAVIGEPGVGKSRLFLEFTRSHRTQVWLVLEGRSVPYAKATAWFPIIDLLKTYFGIQDRDNARTIRERVTGKLFTLDDTLKPMLPAFLTLFDVPVVDGAWQVLDPPQRRRHILNALKALFLKESEVQPLVLMFEDLHWMDNETQELLDSLVESLPAARVLLLINYRPEYEHGWGSRTYYTQCRIDPLPPESAEELLAILLGDDASLTPLKRILIERTEGNPFFMEESVRTLVEIAVLAGEPGAFRLTQDIQSVEVPATVQGVLAARIDRLAVEDKQLLQTAAVIGKDVPYDLLQAISDLSEDDLRRGLGNLQAAEFLYETRLFPDLEYTFKHALTHDVTYGSLLQERRRVLHQQIAEAIETIFADRLTEQVERLAHHYTEAGLVEQAIGYWHQAGQRAIERCANAEAIKHLSKGLALLETLPDTPERAQRELKLQISLGVSMQAARGAGSPEVGTIYTRARELCEHVGETSEVFVVLWGSWRYYRQGRNFQKARALAEELLRLGEHQHDPALLIQALHAQWTTRFYLGEYASAVEHTEQGVSLYDPQEHHVQAFRFGGHDACICGLTIAAWSLWALGYPDQASKRIDQSLALARKLNHPWSLGLALDQGIQVHELRGENDAVLEGAESLLTLAAEVSYAEYQATAEFLRGRAWMRQGKEEAGAAEMLRVRVSRRAAGAEIEEPYFVSLAAAAYRGRGESEEGLGLLDEVLSETASSGMRYWDAELHRLKGELLLSLPEADCNAAEECFKQAVDVARGQNTRSLELRAATSLSRLWHDQAKPEAARALLAPIYQWFSEGFDTADLQKARALLDELV
jgi:class 3 adenylate cyclase/predicted ATPase